MKKQELGTGYNDMNGRPIFYKDSVTLDNGEKGMIMISNGEPCIFYLDEPAKTPLHQIHNELITHGKTKTHE